MTAYPPAIEVGGNWVMSDRWVGAINDAATAHGVPPNLVRAVLQRESGGRFDPDANPTDEYCETRKKPDGSCNLLMGFSGVYETTAATWGCDWEAMATSPAAQIDCIAKGLARLDRDYGDTPLPLPGGGTRPPLPYEAALLVYHGGTRALTAAGYADETGLRSRDYADKALADWAGLDRLSGGDMATPTIYDLSTPAGVSAYNARYPDATLDAAELADLLTSRVTFRTGRPEGICLHVQEGSTKWSVQEHAAPWRDASANAYLNLDGSIVLAVPRTFGAWTQGIKTSGDGASYPSARGRTFRDRFGGVDANQLVLSIEFEGDDQGPHPDVQLRSGVWLIREWQRVNPHISDDEIFRHADFDVVNRSYCPGRLYDAVLTLLKGAEPPPPPASDRSFPWPGGLTDADARDLFGELVPGVAPNWTDPKSTFAKAWAERFVATERASALAAIHKRIGYRLYQLMDGSIWKILDREARGAWIEKGS